MFSLELGTSGIQFLHNGNLIFVLSWIWFTLVPYCLITWILTIRYNRPKILGAINRFEEEYRVFLEKYNRNTVSIYQMPSEGAKDLEVAGRVAWGIFAPVVSPAYLTCKGTYKYILTPLWKATYWIFTGQKWESPK